MKLGCNEAEAKYIADIAQMSDADLIKEWEKQEARAVDNKDKSYWYIAERKSIIASLELYDRGFNKKMTWVK